MQLTKNAQYIQDYLNRHGIKTTVVELPASTRTAQEAAQAIGGIPPVGHATKIETYIDEDLLLLPELWAAAGTPNAVFNLDSSVLVKLTGGKVLSIK